jgi:hypothetical protein
VTPDPDANPWADRRGGDRQPARADVRVECRRAGSVPDVAIALLDVSPRGLKLAVR